MYQRSLSGNWVSAQSHAAEEGLAWFRSRGFLMTKIGILRDTFCSAALMRGRCTGADIMPLKLRRPAASAAKPCTDAWTSLPELPADLARHHNYGTIDAGVGWQSHGAPLDTRPLSEPHT